MNNTDTPVDYKPERLEDQLFKAIESFDGDGEAFLIDLLTLFRKHAKDENAALAEMYANTHAKLRDLEKEFSDMKANLHRAYKGLENHKELKLELQKQKELNAELLIGLEAVLRLRKLFEFAPDEFIGEAHEGEAVAINRMLFLAESLIKKSSEI